MLLAIPTQIVLAILILIVLIGGLVALVFMAGMTKVATTEEKHAREGDQKAEHVKESEDNEERPKTG